MNGHEHRRRKIRGKFPCKETQGLKPSGRGPYGQNVSKRHPVLQPFRPETCRTIFRSKTVLAVFACSNADKPAKYVCARKRPYEVSRRWMKRVARGGMRSQRPAAGGRSWSASAPQPVA